MTNKILKLLSDDARISHREIAERLNCSVSEVEAVIHQLESDNIIKGYHAVINDNYLDNGLVKAIIEVKVAPQPNEGFDKTAMRIAKFPEVTSLCLVSGNYDLQLVIEGESLQEIAAFVAKKLSAIEHVTSTSTLFLLKKYKDAGIIFESDEQYERLKVTP